MSEEWAEPVTVDEMYGEWDYESAVAALDRSLHPRTSDTIIDIVASVGVAADDLVADVGGREARHALIMADRFGCRVLSVDPVEANIERGREAIAHHPAGDRVQAVIGSFEDIPAADHEVDLIFSRDTMAHVADAAAAFDECARVLAEDGSMVIHQVFATADLEPREAARLYRDAAVVPERMSADGFEAAAAAAGFRIRSVEVIGSEWVEASQEAQTVPNYLVQISRLRRDRDHLIDEIGELAYRTIHASALWSVYQHLGKLESRVYILDRA